MELPNGALLQLYYRDEEIVLDLAKSHIRRDKIEAPNLIASYIGNHLNRHEGEKFTIKVTFGVARGTITPVAFTQDNKKRVSKMRALCDELAATVTYEKTIHIFGTERGTLYTESPQNSFGLLFSSAYGYWWMDQMCIVCQAGTFYLVWSGSPHMNQVYRAEDGRFCDPSDKFSEWIGLQDLLNELIPAETRVLPISAYASREALPHDGEATGSASI